MRSDLTYASCVGIILLVEPKGVGAMRRRKASLQHEVVTEFVSLTKQRRITTIEDYLKYRRARMRDLSLQEQHLLMTWLSQCKSVRLKGKRHPNAVHSEIEMR